jgi:hypothetical protein
MKAHVQKTIRLSLDMVDSIEEHKKRLEDKSEPYDGPWLGRQKSDSAAILDLIRLGIEAAKEMEIDSHIEAERKIGDPIYKSPELRVETVYKAPHVPAKETDSSGDNPNIVLEKTTGDAPENVSPQTITEKEGRKNTFSL